MDNHYSVPALSILNRYAPFGTVISNRTPFPVSPIVMPVRKTGT